MRINHIIIMSLFTVILLTLISCTRSVDIGKNENQVNQIIEVAPDSINQGNNQLNQSIGVSPEGSNQEDSQSGQKTEAVPNSLNQEDNHSDQSIEVTLKSISQEEYDKWVVPSYDGYYDPDGQPLQLPNIKNFDYPYVEGMEDKKLQDKVNETIKNAIFNEDFFSGPMSAVGVEITPLSEFEFPGIISNKEILSIPIVLWWNQERCYYKSMSVTIDKKTGKRLFLEDIIELNTEFAYRILYEENFFIDIDIGGEKMKEYIDRYNGVDEMAQSEGSELVLKSLRMFKQEDDKPQVEVFYLTKDGIVLTHFANDGVPSEINIPLENLNDFLKIESWKSNDSLQLNERNSQN